MPILGIMASSISGSKAVTNSYESIASVALTSTSSTITFSSIPATYKHLQIRSIATQGTGGSSGSDTFNTARFNGDSGSNYVSHYVGGDGSSAFASATGTSSSNCWFGIATSSTTSAFAANIIDILDYSNTNKYKTIRGLSGDDRNGAGFIILQSALWMSTAAISSIVISAAGSPVLQANSHFALYGVKG
jgi:hypothetical protein